MVASRLFTPVLFVISVILLALNLWVVGPWLLENGGPGFANLLYVALRVGVIVGVPLLLARFKGYTPRKAMACSLFVAAIDQIAFKMVLYSQDAQLNPQAWPGDALQNAFIATVASFVIFSPILMVMGFAGHFAGKQLSAKKASRV
jgi:hypothetical protein